MPRTPAPFRMKFPATSANLGPGFDCLALALRFHLSIQARPAAQWKLTARGESPALCGSLTSNLIVDVYQYLLLRQGINPHPLHLEIHNKIPIGKGCGSSAAARLAAITLAVHFGNLAWSDDEILLEASRLEGHGDNVAACWLGGLVAWFGGGSHPGRPHGWAMLESRASWPLVVAIPAQALLTEKARQVLPAQYAREDAILNLQNSILFALAWRRRRPELLAQAMQDRWHEPYREALCPLLPALKNLAGSHGIAGVALSGAGPSVLLVLRSQAARLKALPAIRRTLQAAGLEARLLTTELEAQGAVRGWRRRARKG